MRVVIAILLAMILGLLVVASFADAHGKGPKEGPRGPQGPPGPPGPAGPQGPPGKDAPIVTPERPGAPSKDANGGQAEEGRAYMVLDVLVTAAKDGVMRTSPGTTFVTVGGETLVFYNLRDCERAVLMLNGRYGGQQRRYVCVYVRQ